MRKLFDQDVESEGQVHLRYVVYKSMINMLLFAIAVIYINVNFNIKLANSINYWQDCGQAKTV